MNPDEFKTEDNKINMKLTEAEGNTRKVLDLMMEKHRLYHKYEIEETDPEFRFKKSTLRQEVFIQIMIYKVKADLEDDIAKIFSRLDDLETKVNSLNQGKQS